jgi:hypothetical protein
MTYAVSHAVEFVEFLRHQCVKVFELKDGHADLHNTLLQEVVQLGLSRRLEQVDVIRLKVIPTPDASGKDVPKLP